MEGCLNGYVQSRREKLVNKTPEGRYMLPAGLETESDRVRARLNMKQIKYSEREKSFSTRRKNWKDFQELKQILGNIGEREEKTKMRKRKQRM